MVRKVSFFYILLSFICLKCFSQDGNIWDYKRRLFVEQKKNMYIVNSFHHKIEMITDTLLWIKDSIYAGKIYKLITKDGQLYMMSNKQYSNKQYKKIKGHKKIKLKVSTNEAIQSRQERRAYYLSHLYK
jgi:hypothetical protein